MFPELFHIEIPEFLNYFFSVDQLTIYSYPFCILIGSSIAYSYFLYAQKKYLNQKHLKLSFVFILIIMAYLGGKFFLIFENSEKYMNEIFTLKFYVSGGFVFYGSLIFCLISVIYILKNKKLPVSKYLDLIAIVTAIVHIFGRTGCFLAGCCYGKPTDSLLGLYFPKNETISVHPTQLYEVFFLSILLITLFKIIEKKNNGTVFTIYILGYAIWRFVLEFFRGDVRGFAFDGLLSHSQIIGICFIIIVAIVLFIKSNSLKFTRYWV